MNENSAARDYQALLGDATVIEADGHGEKVLLRADDSYLKVFRRKRLLTSAAWYPYAQRFADNTVRLHALGIPCPQVLAVHRFPALGRDVVHYQALPGATLRQLTARPAADFHPAHSAADLRTELGRFIATLHQLGVLFRSIHLGNIVVDEAGVLGLIDIADLKIGRRPLSAFQRRRNFVHLLRYRKDRNWLLEDGGAAFAHGYASAADSSYPAALVQHWLRKTQGAGR